MARRILEVARALQRAHSFAELLDVTRESTARDLGYEHVWLCVQDTADSNVLRIIDVRSADRDYILEHAATIPIEGDAMIAELFETLAPVVVEDARTDPRTNKEMVALLGNRTIINVPLMLLDKPVGLLGVGTFNDEGCHPPTEDGLGYLVDLANQVAVAANRIRYAEQARINERERRTLEARIAQIQRLESVGELAGGVAHDFNNLLTVVLSSAMMAKEADNEADRNADLDAVIAAAHRGQELTRQLLSMSRAKPLATVSLAPNDRIAALVPLLRRMIPESVQVDFIPHHHDGHIEADPTQFDQVLMNLAINARDAMGNGGRLTIEIEHVVVNGAFRATHPWAKPGRYLLMTVTDDGDGMPPEVAARVFEPFFTTKGDHAGTGLGLSVAHGIVRQHGGLLHCYSELGVGTTFKIYWPISERSASQVGPKLEGPIRGGSESILIAEDDAAVAGVARRILEGAGYSVAIASSGREACDMATADAFDLVLLDVVMPGPGAHEVLAELDRIRPGMRVLLASGYTADGNVAELVRDSSIQLLSKPYDPDQLLRAVRRRLERP